MMTSDSRVKRLEMLANQKFYRDFHKEASDAVSTVRNWVEYLDQNNILIGGDEFIGQVRFGLVQFHESECTRIECPIKTYMAVECGTTIRQTYIWVPNELADKILLLDSFP